MEKNLDKKGRGRNIIVSFRMSKAESDYLNIKVKLSGLTKQDYIIKRLSEKEITVIGNPRIYKALRNQMNDIYIELKRIKNCIKVDSEFFETIQLVAITLNELEEESDDKQ